MMTLQDVVDAFKAQMTDFKSWFIDGARSEERRRERVCQYV